MTSEIFTATRSRAILTAMTPAERSAMRALRSGAIPTDDALMLQLVRRQMIRLQETSEGEVWVFTRLGGEIADWLQDWTEPEGPAV